MDNRFFHGKKTELWENKSYYVDKTRLIGEFLEQAQDALNQIWEKGYTAGLEGEVLRHKTAETVPQNIQKNRLPSMDFCHFWRYN